MNFRRLCIVFRTFFDLFANKSRVFLTFWLWCKAKKGPWYDQIQMTIVSCKVGAVNSTNPAQLLTSFAAEIFSIPAPLRYIFGNITAFKSLNKGHGDDFQFFLLFWISKDHLFDLRQKNSYDTLFVKNTIGADGHFGLWQIKLKGLYAAFVMFKGSKRSSGWKFRGFLFFDTLTLVVFFLQGNEIPR